MPTSRTTCITDASTGASWLTGPRRPRVASTAVRPSRTGIPAATSAPKANSRMMRVRPSDRNIEEAISLLLLSSVALLMLASPDSSMRSSGWAFAAASTAASEFTTFFSAVF
jgi:hypothetical protein